MYSDFLYIVFCYKTSALVGLTKKNYVSKNYWLRVQLFAVKEKDNQIAILTNI